MNSLIVNNFEQSIPLWDENEQVQTVKKSLIKLKLSLRFQKLELCLLVLVEITAQPLLLEFLLTKSNSHGKPKQASNIRTSMDL